MFFATTFECYDSNLVYLFDYIKKFIAFQNCSIKIKLHSS